MSGPSFLGASQWPASSALRNPSTPLGTAKNAEKARFQSRLEIAIRRVLCKLVFCYLCLASD